MAGNKTTTTATSVSDFIAAVDHPGKRSDAELLDPLFRRVTGAEPRMWGPTIIGYGQYSYSYDSGHGGEMCRVGFSPRKAKHSLYLLACGADMDGTQFAALLERLGKYSQGKSCLYVNKLADIDLGVLEEMIALSWENSLQRYPE